MSDHRTSESLMYGVVAFRGREPALTGLLHGLARTQFRTDLARGVEQLPARPPFHASGVIAPSLHDAEGRE
jgi:hypothetical protein